MTERTPILIVEDDPLVRTALAEFLEDEGHETVGVGHGLEALDYLETREHRGLPLPGLILLDVRMPVMDGVEFLEHKESRPALRSIPVIVLKAGDDEVPVSPAIVAVIHKPIMHGLMTTVSGVLGQMTH